MFVLYVGLFGSLWLRMLCDPWQLMQFAATSNPSLLTA